MIFRVFPVEVWQNRIVELTLSAKRHESYIPNHTTPTKIATSLREVQKVEAMYSFSVFIWTTMYEPVKIIVFLNKSIFKVGHGFLVGNFRLSTSGLAFKLNRSPENQKKSLQLYFLIEIQWKIHPGVSTGSSNNFQKPAGLNKI